jgi:hypothetical protein
MSEIRTEEELMQRLEALGDITEEQRKEAVCVLLGHSMVHTFFFGYHYCARCGDQVGDSLGSVYFCPQEVVVGHMGGNCPTCRENYAKLGWQDKFLCPDPFAKEADSK